VRKWAETAHTTSSFAAASDSRGGRRRTAPWERDSTQCDDKHRLIEVTMGLELARSLRDRKPKGAVQT